MKRLILLITILITSFTLTAQEKGRLGLLNVRSSNLDRSLLSAIDRGIREKLNSSNRFVLITQEEMERGLGLSPVEALENCKGDIMCISQMGDIVKVYWLLSISILKEKGSIVLRGILYNIPNAKIDLRLLKTFSMSDRLVKDIAQYVEEALKKIGTGSINVNAPKDFQVYIDGTFYSTAPIIVDGLASGIHKVRIKRGEKDCYVSDVNVSASEISEINLERCDDLTKTAEPDIKSVVSPKGRFYEEPAFIVSSSATLMFLTAGIVFGILSRSDEDKVKNAKCEGAGNQDSLCEQINAKEILDSADTKAKAANISFLLSGAAALTSIGIAAKYYLKTRKKEAELYFDGRFINLSFSY